MSTSVLAVFVILVIHHETALMLLTSREGRIRAISAQILFFGLMSILGTYLGVATEGFVVNFRAIGAALGGITGGLPVGLGAGILGGVHRMALGGPLGVPCGLATILVGIIAATVSGRRGVEDTGQFSAALAVFVGEAIHLPLVLAMARPPEIGVEFVSAAAAALLLVNPLGMALLSKIIRDARSGWTTKRERMELARKLEGNLRSVLDLVATVIDARDPYTGEHSHHVAEYAALLGFRMGFSQDEVGDLRIAGLLHDVGKVGTPDAILTKPSRLTSEEFSTVKKHPELGAAIVNQIEGLAHLAPLIRHHHERYCGAGYPSGEPLTDLKTAILSAADALDAMASDRAYRRALVRDEIIGEVCRGRGTQFHPVVADCVIELLEEGLLLRDSED